jgi:hypothetical protein
MNEKWVLMNFKCNYFFRGGLKTKAHALGMHLKAKVRPILKNMNILFIILSLSF